MCTRAVALTCNVDADRLAEGRDNDKEVEVGSPKEIVDPLSETPDRDDDRDNDKEVEVGNPKEIVDPLSERPGRDDDRDNDDPTEVDNPKEIVDPLSETPGRDDDAPELGRPLKEVDGRVTDNVGRDVDWPRKLLSETLDPTKVGADVEGTVITGETEDSDKPTDDKLVEALSELYDRLPVDSPEESDKPTDGKLVEALSELYDRVPVDSTEDRDGPSDGKDVERLSESYDRVPVGSAVESPVI
jgi:hypothetical protein